MSSFDKKSSIPRPTQNECDRLAKTKPKASLLSQKPKQQSKPAPEDGLIHQDADVLRRSLQSLEADHDRMKQTLEETVKDAEDRLEAMRKLMEEREKRMAGTLETQTEKIAQLEKAVDDCEKKLLENDIDPATMDKMQPTEEQAQQVEKQRKVTKAEVSKMREKLHEMNQKSDQYLSDVQHIMQELRELEATSSRAGGLPVGELPPEDLARLVEESKEAEAKAGAGQLPAAASSSQHRPQQQPGSDSDSSPSPSPRPQEAGAKSDILLSASLPPRPLSQPPSSTKSDVFLTET